MTWTLDLLLFVMVLGAMSAGLNLPQWIGVALILAAWIFLTRGGNT